MYNIYKKVFIFYNKMNPEALSVVVDASNQSLVKKYSHLYSDKYETENKDFIVSILYPNFCGSGPNTDALCSVEKDGICWKILLNSNMVFEALKTDIVIKGKFNNKMMFCAERKLGILHDDMFIYDMSIYKKAKADTDKRQEYKRATKTKKRLPGYRYFNLSEDLIYLCDLYSWAGCGFDYKQIAPKDNFIYTNIPRKYSLYLNHGNLPKSCSKLSDVFELLLDKKFSSYMAFKSWPTLLVEKVEEKSRAKGKQILVNDLTDDLIEEYLEKIRKHDNDYYEKELSRADDCCKISISKFLMSTSYATLPHNFTKEQERFFNLLELNSILKNCL